MCVCVCIYIYIYIMIINIYIYIYIYIYIIHGKYCSTTSGVLKFITTFIRQLRRWNEIENATKYRQKAVKILFVCGLKCVWVYV